MAKRKRPTALFEVISKSKQYRPARPATAKGGNWLSHATAWFSRPKFKPIVSADRLQPQSAVAAQDMEYDEPAAASAQEAAFAEPVDNDLPEETAAPVAPLPAAPVAVAEAPAAEVKPDYQAGRQQIDVKWSYGTVAVVAMAVALVGGVAILVAHTMTRTSTPLLSETTTQELRKGPAHREVLDPPRRGTVYPGALQNEPKIVRQRETASETSGAPAITPAPAVADTRRYINLNYVMIQSYPEAETEMANKAAVFLNAHGVACTVEHDVKGFLRVSVVGLDGFTRISSPEYKAYVEHIRVLSGEFAKGAHSFKAFDPCAKKWDKAD